MRSGRIRESPIGKRWRFCTKAWCGCPPRQERWWAGRRQWRGPEARRMAGHCWARYRLRQWRRINHTGLCGHICCNSWKGRLKPPPHGTVPLDFAQIPLSAASCRTAVMNAVVMNASDAIELALTIVLCGIALCWRPYLAPAAARLAERPRTCLAIIATLPLVLRLALLAAHPVPVPSNYDEFSHLLVTDTLLNGRLANPAHSFARFFETFFVLQQPTYSSIYPPGLGFSMAVGRLLFGLPWAGVLLTTASFAAACYWMLRAWTTPVWALGGGVLAALSFGPLSPWMNTYWGGSWTATAGCLVFGALPRLRKRASLRDGALLGI